MRVAGAMVNHLHNYFAVTRQSSKEQAAAAVKVRLQEVFAGEKEHEDE